MDLLETSASMSKGERVTQGLMYGALAAVGLIGGWLWGSLLERNTDTCSGRDFCDNLGFIGLLWPATVVISIVVLGLVFIARPVRPHLRAAWAMTAAFAFFGAYRAAGMLGAILAAAIAGLAGGVVRRRAWKWSKHAEVLP